ncbi:MBOAT family O-acyltransferase [Butyrivibrio sp. MC2013]|uniref:MBOAT family O-acyltransferase n=1 Tax=Butyrivibrio sp. MC2013 TaxID=1280686 RepID=UPI0018CA0959|nr:MBOAT family O-acyltransferase [Butyrivibrio sp. MC2013]
MGQRRLAEPVLLAASLIFYATYSVEGLVVLICSLLFNGICSRALMRKEKQKGLLFFGISADLVLLILFRYSDFIGRNAAMISGREFTPVDIFVPAGISYFTFRQIAFLVDSYRHETCDMSFVEYALFITYFPSLIMGPVTLHGEFISQLRDEKSRKPDYYDLSTGFIWLTVGMTKKLLLVPVFAGAADFAYGDIGRLSFAESWACALAYTIQIYLDFSGYCDMAGGVSRMLGIDLPVNFRSPYKALSIKDFWKKWHITLNRFLTRYIYIPLGGSRKGMIRTLINIMIIFIISGIWHGAAWTFIAWGLFHGCLMVFERLLGDRADKLPSPVRWLYTFFMVNIGWVFFRAGSMGDALAYLKKMFGAFSLYLSPEFYSSFGLNSIPVVTRHLNYAVPLIYIFVMAGILIPANLYDRKYKPGALLAAGTVILFALSLNFISQATGFIYFKF